jgi:tetratricopeptide (TPR) repeat protein
VEPLGTITMCFPYVDEETKRVLKAAMDEAENYADFTERLCERVCKHPSPPLLEYFSLFFAFHISDYRLVDNLANAGKTTDLVGPFLQIVKYRRGDSVYWNDMQDSLEKAVKAAPNDWITAHLYLKWRYYAELNFPESEIESEHIESITKGVSNEKELEFFKSYLLRFKAIRAHFDSHFDEVVELLYQALLIARKYDEQVAVADILSGLADNVKSNPDPKLRDLLGLEGEGRELIIQLLNMTKEASEILGYRYRVGYVQHNFGHYNGVWGKLNLAIELLDEFYRIRNSLGLSVDTLNTMFAFYYNQMGAGKEALEHVDAAIQSSDPHRRLSSWALAQRAWALINLGRFDEARADLEASKELASKGGVAIHWFVWFQIVEGILYRMERNFEAAKSTFIDVYEYLEGHPLGVVDNICLLNLTEIEIETYDSESMDKPTDSSGPWMEGLEERVGQSGSLGVVAQSMILKAKFLQHQGRFDEMKRTLRRVQTISLEPGLGFLNNMVMTAFPDIVLT